MIGVLNVQRCKNLNKWQKWWAFSLHFPQMYAPQTKILEAWTKRRVCVFEVLSKGVSTRFGRRVIENSVKNAHVTLCSIFQKSSFGEHKMRSWLAPMHHRVVRRLCRTNSHTTPFQSNTNRPEILTITSHHFDWMDFQQMVEIFVISWIPQTLGRGWRITLM